MDKTEVIMLVTAVNLINLSTELFGRVRLNTKDPVIRKELHEIHMRVMDVQFELSNKLQESDFKG